MRSAALAVLALVAFAAPASAQVIYSSLPLHGAGSQDARDTLAGEQLALAESGAPVTLRSLDDSTRQAGNWDPAQTARNARRAALDPATIAYLGEFNSGASAISIPILNEAGIPQISPSNTYPGLTRTDFHTAGEPGKYYPSGTRTYVRVAPADHLQAAAIATLVRNFHRPRVAVVHDGEVYGRGMGKLVAADARALGLQVVLDARLGRRGRNAAAIARRVRSSRALAVVFTGVTANGAARLVRAVDRAAPKTMLVASDGCLDPAFTRALNARAAERMLITSANFPGAKFGPAGAAFAQRYRARFGRGPGTWGAFGYEAMALALDAINRAGGPTPDHRAAIAQALFGTRDRDSVLGRYSIDADGDTTLRRFGVYKVRARRPAFAFSLDSAGG